MTDETMKRDYRTLQPPAELKARVLSACRAARKKRAALRRRAAGMAACLAVALCLSVYGFSPVPGLSSQGQAMENGALSLAPQTIWIGGAASQRTASPYGVQPTALGETVDGCLALTVDRAARLTVSAGTLYAPDETGAVTEAGETCRVSAGAEVYWQVDTAQEEATLTVRGPLRSVTYTLTEGAEGWSLQK